MALHLNPERHGWVEAFRRKLAGSPSEWSVFELCVELAAPEYPHLSSDDLRGQLDAWARNVHARLKEISDAPRTASLLAGVCHVLFREEGFQGDREQYSDPRNSFINEVISRRKGLPITLSVLFVEVARKVGLTAHGVAFPGHFLARVDDPDDDGTFVIVDSFAGGTIMGVADLQTLLNKQAGREVTLSPRMLEPAAPRVVILRMLRNLKASYTEDGDYKRALLAQERIMVLTGDEPGEVRDHGLLLAGAREPGNAIVQLERYTSLMPKADDLAEIEKTIQMLKEHAFNVQ